MPASSDPFQIEIFKHLFASVAEEMGAALRRSSYSPNIKERLDFSCALFDPEARMIAQAAHIPVHLGAMPLSVQACIEHLDLGPRDVAMLNDPYKGGTHLPDITLVAPIHASDDHGAELVGYTASRAHHADVGGAWPGSMGLSREIFQEGLILPPTRLVQNGVINDELLDILCNNVRTPDERLGDLKAQLAANQVGQRRMRSLVRRYGIEEVQGAAEALLGYAERMTRQLLRELPNGIYRFTDRMDDDGVVLEPAEITVAIRIHDDHAVVDFTGTSPQRQGAINAVYAITLSATYYVFRSLIGLDVPSNSGCMAPIEVVAPEGSLVNAAPPAAVAGGNVETSQRIVDVLLGALAGACPDRIPAASQGTMNNLTIGGWDASRRRPFSYYETLGGGMGAGPGKAGVSAIHSHMTNTLNTPIEALEFAYPLRVRRYEIRTDSGGAGRNRGGDGLVREIELLGEAEISILSDRRVFPPYGLDGGSPGAVGRNALLRRRAGSTSRDLRHRGGAEAAEATKLPGKITFQGKPGDVIRIETPGGGGHGSN